MAKKKTGKGVDALFMEEQAEAKKRERRDKDAKAKREKRAKQREERERARNGFPPWPREVTPSASTHTEGGAFDPNPPMKTSKPHVDDGWGGGSLDIPTPPDPAPGSTNVTFYDGMSPDAAERLKRSIDEAAARPRTAGGWTTPSRRREPGAAKMHVGGRTFAEERPAPTLAALAQSFDDACARTEEKQAELDEALRQQAAAKQALDQAVSRRANGEHA
jgi:hypothetical protein